MTNWVNNVFTKACLSLGACGIIVVCIIAMVVQCAICVALSLIKQEYSLRKRLWCVFSICGTALIFIGLLIVIPAPPGYSVFTVGFAVLLLCPLFSIGEKQSQDQEEQKELARFIDKEFIRASRNNRKETAFEQANEGQKTSACACKPTEEEVKNYGIDFQHVKNVIKRMDYFGLNANDKKQVRELECALLEAERGLFTHEIKCRINDGLSALLKIMSKYGV